MPEVELTALLEEVAAGSVSVVEATGQILQASYRELGFAKLDLEREQRTGVAEAVYAEGKTDKDLLLIAEELLHSTGRFLVTRLAASRVAPLMERFPEAVYRERARVLSCGVASAGADLVTVVAAGTSDLPAAEEAGVCVEWLGARVEQHYDVGLAGVHRLFDCLPAIRLARVVIVAAGMDGALPTLVAGLVRAPVIALPTSVGYGSSFGGLAALLTMLNACSPGVAVVNIDNGYGAAVLAHRILNANSS